MSQRKFADYDIPSCELPESQHSIGCNRKAIACKTNLKGYYIGECRVRYFYFDDPEYKECPAGKY